MKGTVIYERLEAASVQIGVVNLCPNCGHTHVTDWTWDANFDPFPEHGNINIQYVGVVMALSEIASAHGQLSYLECLPSCPEAVIERYK